MQILDFMDIIKLNTVSQRDKQPNSTYKMTFLIQGILLSGPIILIILSPLTISKTMGLLQAILLKKLKADVTCSREFSLFIHPVNSCTFVLSNKRDIIH